jgi:glycerophosphoryl diester phosphodiesterase
MPMLLSDLPKPAIIAHRGACAFAPENTLASFELALRQGADAVELDAKLTQDGHIVVIHDQTVDRTTMHSGWVRDLSLAQLRKMDAGSHFDIAFAGEAIPTLDEVFKAVGKLTYTNVELTNLITPLDNLPGKTAALVKRHKILQRVWFSSFNPIALLRIHRLLPESPIGLLAWPGAAGWWARSPLGRLIPYQSLHVAMRDAKPGLIKRMHHDQRKVFVYTINLENEMLRLFEMGVDGIFTDDPLLARRVLNGVGQKIRDSKESRTN